MATDVVMPRLSDTMEEGTLVKWLKRVGDTVAVGDVLAEVETDKATMELEAFDAGVLSEIRVAEGEAAPVGAVIAVLGGAGEQRPAASAAAPQKGATPQPPAKEPPAEKPPAKEPPAKAPPVNEPPREKPPVKEGPAKPSGAPPASAGAQPRTMPPGAETERVRASPRARRLASERGVDLTSVRGSGPGGRVLEQDLEAASASRPAPAQPAAEPQPGTGDRRVPLGKIRRTTAQRMAAATREVPHFYASSEIDVETLVQVKDELRGQGGEWQRITVTHLLLKAVGLALRAVPELNASWADDAVLLHETVNIGLAVATDDGLLVPVVRNCDTEPLAELVRRAQGVVERVRSRRIAGDDLVGGTFTISNLGMYPVSQFAAVVNPPHAGILAVGAIRATPVVRGKRIVPGQVMAVTLSCDHRVVDGVIAGRFLDALKTRLEEPRTLLD